MIGSTVVAIRPMTSKELEDEGWEYSQWHVPVVVVLSDGSLLYPSRDDEGNGPGTMFGVNKNGKHIIITPPPVSSRPKYQPKG